MRKQYFILFILLSVKLSSQEVITINKADLGYFHSPEQLYNVEDSLPQSIDMNCFIGDYWYKSEGFSSAVSFEGFSFHTDGTFAYKKGYSGGIYLVTTFLGKYKLDKNHNTIHLTVKKIKPDGHMQTKHKTLKSEVPDELKIIGYNDNKISVKVANASKTDTLVFFRTTGCMKEQTWRYDKSETKEYKNNKVEFDENDWEHDLEFDDFGQFVYTAENTWSKYKKLKFVGTYHLYNNIIYLEIRSKSTYDPSLGKDTTERFDAEKKTYIRVDSKKRRVNLSDLMDLINDNISRKNWNYIDCHYKTEHPIPHSMNDEWIVMTLVKNE